MAISLVELAEYVATRFHEGQFRKHSTSGAARPYIYHPLKVCDFLIDNGIYDENLLASSILHDIVEDCTGHITFDYGTITKLFNKEVSDLIYWVSHPEIVGNRTQRWVEYLKHYRQAPDKAKLLKLADRICNLTEYLEFWDSVPDCEKNFIRKVYLQESRELSQCLQRAL